MSDNQRDKANEQRNSIISIAAEKMRHVGIKSISIDDICRDLGMSKKTFYVYFENKEELIRSLLQHQEQYIENWILNATEGKSITELLLNLMAISMQARDVRKSPPLHYDLRKYYPQLFFEHTEHIKELSKRLILKLLQQGKEEGIFRSDLDTNKTANIFAFLHHEMMNLSTTIKEEDYSCAVEHVKYSIDIFMRGIISEEGKKQIEAELKKQETKSKDKIDI